MGDPPKRIAIADFNGDGKPDLAIAVDTSTSIFGRVNIRLNQGNGTFPTGTDYNVGQSIHPTSVIASDLNGDGKADFAVVTLSDPTQTTTVRVYSGNGNGTFGGPTFYPVDGANPNDLIATDFNLDGKIDMAIVNNVSEDVSIFTGLNAGGFSLVQSISTGEQPRMITA